jgi:hypothetical protein
MEKFLIWARLNYIYGNRILLYRNLMEWQSISQNFKFWRRNTLLLMNFFDKKIGLRVKTHKPLINKVKFLMQIKPITN